MGRKPTKMDLESTAARILYTARQQELRGERREIAAALSEEEATEVLKMTEDDAAAIRMITRSIATQKEIRNSATYLQMLRTKLEWTRQKPAAKVEVDGGLEVVVRTVAESYRPSPEGTSFIAPGVTGGGEDPKE